MNNKYAIKDIEKLMDSTNIAIIGDDQRTFSGIGSLYNASIEDLAFCSMKGSSSIPLLEGSKAGVILCWNDVNPPMIENKTLILVENPRLWFIRCAKRFFPQNKQYGIHPTAIIGENCTVGEDVYIGPYAVIGNNVTIQKGSYIGSNVRISENVRMGLEVKVKSGCVIGSEGFGLEKNEFGAYERFPHYGSVLIGDQVEIGANTCIDRGTLSDTIIGDRTKIDNLVHIAHNVVIGKDCIIVCLSCIAGSVIIGDGVWIAPQVVLRDGVKIGDQAVVGMGAVVTKNVESFDVVAGVPAKSIKKVNV